MKLTKIIILLVLFMGTTVACELPFQVTTNDTIDHGSCKGLILEIMKDQKCSSQEIEAVRASEIVANSESKNGVSFCSLTTNRGVYSAMEDFMSEPPVSSVFFSIWD